MALHLDSPVALRQEEREEPASLLRAHRLLLPRADGLRPARVRMQLAADAREPSVAGAF